MTEPWWKGAILYHVYVRSFYDSDGDGHGDLPGLQSKLDYIQGLGVDGLWLSPIHPSPNRDWGYDIADFEGVQGDSQMKTSRLAWAARGLESCSTGAPHLGCSSVVCKASRAARTGPKQTGMSGRTRRKQDRANNWLVWRSNLGLPADAARLPPQVPAPAAS